MQHLRKPWSTLQMIQPSKKLQVEKLLTKVGMATTNSLHGQDYIFFLCVHLKIYML